MKKIPLLHVVMGFEILIYLLKMDRINAGLLDVGGALYRCSAKAVVIQDRKLLTTIEPEGWLGLPGGGIDYGEPIEEALFREIKEEIDLDRKSVHFDKILFISNSAIVDTLPRFNVYYEVSLDFKDKGTDCELKCKWIDKEGLKSENLAPGLQAVKEKIIKLL